MKKSHREPLKAWLKPSMGLNAAAVITALFLIWQMGIVTMAVSPIVCRGCHQVRPNVESLGKSPHANINCLYCHGDNSALGLLSLQVRSTGNVVSHLLMSKNPASTEVDDFICLGCHGNALKQTSSSSKGIRVSHKEIVSAGWSCSDCHGAVAHEIKGQISTYPNMNDCLSCHNGEIASNDCGYCHRKDMAIDRQRKANAISVVHGSTWKVSHGLGDMSTCEQCHQKDFCGNCHKVELPHPEPWAFLHSMTTAPESECYKCHKKSFCQDCHTLDIPHPPEFLAEHVDVIHDKGIETCAGCHTANSCEGCHEKAAHTNVPRFYK